MPHRLHQVIRTSKSKHQPYCEQSRVSDSARINRFVRHSVNIHTYSLLQAVIWVSLLTLLSAANFPACPIIRSGSHLLLNYGFSNCCELTVRHVTWREVKIEEDKEYKHRIGNSVCVSSCPPEAPFSSLMTDQYSRLLNIFLFRSWLSFLIRNGV